MVEKQEQAAGYDPAKRAAAEGHLRQALVGWAKAKSETQRHGTASQGGGARDGRWPVRAVGPMKREPDEGAIGALEGRGRDTGRQVDQQLRLGEGPAPAPGGAQTDAGSLTNRRRQRPSWSVKIPMPAIMRKFPLSSRVIHEGYARGSGDYNSPHEETHARAGRTIAARPPHPRRLQALQTNATAVRSASATTRICCDILNGRTRNPRTDTIRKIAEALKQPSG